MALRSAWSLLTVLGGGAPPHPAAALGYGPVGALLGGLVGVGTVVYALAIGPLVQLMLPYCIVQLPEVTAASR